jgi:hypothetical protein
MLGDDQSGDCEAKARAAGGLLDSGTHLEEAIKNTGA